jgi:hypothetical protein
MSTAVVIVDGDKIKDLLEQLAPPQVAPYVQYLTCGMDQNGNNITFTCSASGSDGVCFVSSTESGSGSADSDSFTLTVDAELSVQGATASCGPPRHCTLVSVTEALKVGTRARVTGLTTSNVGVRYN